MDLIFPDVGLVWLLRRVVGVGLKYHLYVNNHAPGVSTTLASLTEATYSGYAPILVAAADWTVSAVAGHVGDLEAMPIAFLNSSGVSRSAYGYYVTDNTNTQLVCAASFDEPPVVKAYGESWIIEPILGSYSGLEA